ncbi:MAG: hypothetical protein AAF799_01220 [Myxococcota bacterium]
MVRKSGSDFGIELEIPLVALDGGSVEPDVAVAALERLVETFALEPGKRDASGRLVAATNTRNGDFIAFEYCFHMIELALAPGQDLNEVAERSYDYLRCMQQALAPEGVVLSGLGLHPNFQTMNTDPLEVSNYRLLRHFAQVHPKQSQFYHRDFFAFVNASQVHVDCSVDELPDVFRVYSKLDWIFALLFSNSIVPPREGEAVGPWVGSRDLFYADSVYGTLEGNLGPHDRDFRSVTDVCEAMADLAMWKTPDPGLICFRPLPLRDYLLMPETETLPGWFMEDWTKPRETVVHPSLEHLEGFKGFKNITLTKHKTVEIRSFCEQPLRDAFAPAAFVLGCREHLLEVEEVLDALGTSLSNSELRRLVNVGRQEEIAPAAEMRKVLERLVELSHRGLQERGRGEEVFLKPLYRRAEQLECPGGHALRLLRSGSSMRSIVEAYAEF